ncbi:MAG: DUF5103 domain-containing protein [Bacteroidales bacterium]|nr:DUF5103 domain-containing protein [Bacteroidales bacterium]
MRNTKQSIYPMIFFMILICDMALPQSEYVDEFCSDPDIKTILLFNNGWEQSMPVFNMEGENKLSLHFDRLTDDIENYSYSIQYCTYNWKIADLPEHEYLNGFNDIPIYDSKPSSNTTIYYTHYSAKVPSDEITLLKSGNYILKVYRSGYPDDVIFIRRFCAMKERVKISAEVKKPDLQGQELRVSVDLETLRLNNPLEEVKIVILKNYNWHDQLKIANKPVLRNSEIFVDMPYQVYTSGGNEYRNFDIKNTKYVSERIEKIDFRNPYFHIILKPDKTKQFTPYFSSPDLDGLFAVDANDTRNKHNESDYVYVHFTLETEYPFDTDVYIYGALTGWKTGEDNYMEFNTDKGVYEKVLFLKQGYYNYQYVLKYMNKEELDFELTEGNHSETENMYMIFVYADLITSDYDELVGYQVVSSVEGE